MDRKQSEGGGTIFIAFVMGALTGAALALLWAPLPGEETRRYLAERARESKEKAAQVARQGREFVTQQRESLTEAIAQGREAYQQARDKEQV